MDANSLNNSPNSSSNSSPNHSLSSSHEILPLQERYLTLADGSCIHALHGRHRQGQGRPTLVLLHEGLGHLRIWKTFPQQLAERCGCDLLVYERVGYGDSSPIELPRPDDFLQREAEYYLPQVADAAGIERMILFGHSDGGTIALLAAAALGERVLGIVTEAAHLYADELTLQGLRDAVQRFWHGDLKPRLARYHGERTERVFRAWSETWLREDFWRNTDFRPWLARIQCPALVIQGLDDQYGEVRQVEDICAGIGPAARPLLLEACGHVPHLECPTQILASTEAFVRELLD